MSATDVAALSLQEYCQIGRRNWWRINGICHNKVELYTTFERVSVPANELLALDFMESTLL
jgi:hypothetical protein